MLAGWVVALVVIIMVGSALPAENRANYQTPGAESTEAYDLLGERFPARQGDSIKLVFAGDIDDPAVQGRVEEVIETADVPAPRQRRRQPVRAGGRVADLRGRPDRLRRGPLRPAVRRAGQRGRQLPEEFLDAIDPGERDGLQVEVSTFIGTVAPGSEFIGLIFAAFVLLIAFGSVLAMGLPIVTALFGLGIGAVLGGIASRLIETPDWAPTVALMIGLGTGIDYALFIVSRYRQSLHRGLSPREATITAMGTAGRAVLFAGATVVISLLGMLTMGLSYLHGVAGSSVAGRAGGLAASLTLLPALLGLRRQQHRPAAGAVHRPAVAPGRAGLLVPLEPRGPAPALVRLHRRASPCCW